LADSLLPFAVIIVTILATISDSGYAVKISFVVRSQNLRFLRLMNAIILLSFSSAPPCAVKIVDTLYMRSCGTDSRLQFKFGTYYIFFRVKDFGVDVVVGKSTRISL
jgi:hypothetical protein